MDEINRKTATELIAEDIDTIIAYHRKLRARKASGEKIQGPSVDLSAIMNKLGAGTSSAPVVKRRI
jgi:hypothetical protein